MTRVVVVEPEHVVLAVPVVIGDLAVVPGKYGELAPVIKTLLNVIKTVHNTKNTINSLLRLVDLSNNNQHMSNQK